MLWCWFHFDQVQSFQTSPKKKLEVVDREIAHNVLRCKMVKTMPVASHGAQPNRNILQFFFSVSFVLIRVTKRSLLSRSSKKKKNINTETSNRIMYNLQCYNVICWPKWLIKSIEQPWTSFWTNCMRERAPRCVTVMSVCGFFNIWNQCLVVPQLKPHGDTLVWVQFFFVVVGRILR